MTLGLQSRRTSGTPKEPGLNWDWEWETGGGNTGSLGVTLNLGTIKEFRRDVIILEFWWAWKISWIIYQKIRFRAWVASKCKGHFILLGQTSKSEGRRGGRYVQYTLSEAEDQVEVPLDSGPRLYLGLHSWQPWLLCGLTGVMVRRFCAGAVYNLQIGVPWLG